MLLSTFDIIAHLVGFCKGFCKSFLSLLNETKKQFFLIENLGDCAVDVRLFLLYNILRPILWDDFLML